MGSVYHATTNVTAASPVGVEIRAPFVPQRTGYVWGNVRKLPSGRFQARHTVNGRTHTAATTFATKR